MEGLDVEQLIAAAEPWLRNRLTEAAQPWRLIQLGVIAALALASWIAARRLRPRLDAWGAAARPTAAQARLAAVLGDRLWSLLFALAAWAVVLAMREATWPSRSFLIGIAAALATAFTLVGIATRLIRNRTMRGLVFWAGWIAASLFILGLMPQTVAMLDSVAVTFGETRVSLLLIVRAAIVGGALLLAARWLSEAASRRLSALDDISPSMRVLSEKALIFLIYGVAVLVALDAVGFELTTLAVFSGAIGLGVGFGLQKVVSNLVSGVILLLDKSIKPGDVISLGDTFGWITGLNARYVSVVTRDGREYLIPNEDLITGQVVNWSYTDQLVRLDLHFGVDYASDPHEVRRIARETAATVGRVAASPAPVCHITGFGDSSIDFILRFWISDPSKGLTNVRGDVFLALWDAFKAAGVHIPFPRRDVTIRNAPPPPAPTPEAP